MKWLLRFLRRQLLYALWIGGFLAGGYAILLYFHEFWPVGSVMFFIAVISVVAWFLSFFDSESWASDQSSRSRENPFEVQRREFEEDMNQYQREEEDRLS